MNPGSYELTRSKEAFSKMWKFYLEQFIGRPTSLGWSIGAGYLIIVILCGLFLFRTVNMVPHDQISMHRILWRSIVVAMILLGILRLLDLQFRLADFGRAMAITQGWYEQRHTVQVLFIAGVGVAGLIMLFLTEWVMPNIWRHHKLTLCGIVFLIAYIVISAVSFHPIDQILNQKIGGAKVSSIFELSGVACIGISLFVNFLRLTKRMTTSGAVSGTRYI